MWRPIYRMSAPSALFSRFSSSPSLERWSSRGWSSKAINGKLTVVVVVFVFDHHVVFVLFWWSRGCWSSQAISPKLTVVVFLLIITWFCFCFDDHVAADHHKRSVGSWPWWFLLHCLIITPASQTGASLIRNCQTNDDLEMRRTIVSWSWLHHM